MLFDASQQWLYLDRRVRSVSDIRVSNEDGVDVLGLAFCCGNGRLRGDELLCKVGHFVGSGARQGARLCKTLQGNAPRFGEVLAPQRAVGLARASVDVCKSMDQPAVSGCCAAGLPEKESP